MALRRFTRRAGHRRASVHPAGPTTTRANSRVKPASACASCSSTRIATSIAPANAGRAIACESLEARTDTNGKPTVVAGQRASGEFRVQSGSAAVLLDECVQTFAYWNPSILDARRLLNPQTGEYVDVKVLLMGREVMQGQQTDRYRLISSGRTPLEIDIWYTPARDWVALESLTPEGRRLRYTRK